MNSYHVLSIPSILQGLAIKYPYKEENKLIFIPWIMKWRQDLWIYPAGKSLEVAELELKHCLF